jgi:3-methyladenine DNA glycosylase Mpg
MSAKSKLRGYPPSLAGDRVQNQFSVTLTNGPTKLAKAGGFKNSNWGKNV